ncbi:hypothetical protein BJV78DRAFT_554701 [Lactifluus subvellereus]|nr:hypothetical protein BJV78DRAFT_554701 [Lactifluus subvellereus]
MSEKETDSLSCLYTDPLSPLQASSEPRVLAAHRHDIVRNIQSSFLNSQELSQGHSRPQEWVELPYVPSIERTDFKLCPQTWLWWQHPPQFHGQTTLFSGIPDAKNTLEGCLPKTGGLMPESRELSQEWSPDACPSMIPASDGFNGCPWDGSGVFSNVETDVNGAGSGRVWVRVVERYSAS